MRRVTRISCEPGKIAIKLTNGETFSSNKRTNNAVVSELLRQEFDLAEDKETSPHRPHKKIS